MFVLKLKSLESVHTPIDTQQPGATPYPTLRRPSDAAEAATPDTPGRGPQAPPPGSH